MKMEALYRQAVRGAVSRKTTVSLTDEDLLKLAESADHATAQAAAKCAERVALVERLKDVPAHIAGLVADAVAEARESGELVYYNRRISRCAHCGATSTWTKPARRRKEVEVQLSGVELARRFVYVQGHVSVGGCSECVKAAAPIIAAELSGVPAQLPSQIVAEGVSTWVKWGRVKCKKCNWTGHEGQLGRLPAIMGGTYPGRCPSCSAERMPFGLDPFEHIDGFELIEAER